MKELAATLRASGMDENMVQATLGNVMKETGGAPDAENLKGYAKTSNERIRKIFPSATKDITDEELDRVKRNEQEFAELIYGAGSKKGSGLGNTEAGDGWKYRGRGYIQITGKANYAAASKDIYGDDRLVKDPDLVMNPDVAAEVSSWFMNKNQSRMAKSMGVDASNMTEDQAALLATSIIAGQAVKPGKGYLGGENLDKVKYHMGSMPQYARGGITKGISIAGEAGPEAVVPLPDGRTIPVELTSGVSLLSDEQLSRLYPRTDPKEKDATMRDYAVSDLAREEMSRPENIAKQIDLLNLIANSPIVDPKVTSTVDNSIMFAEGGITKGISIAGEAGPEAVVPLPDGRTIPVTIKLSDAAAMGSGAFGENEYTGVNLGPITTDLAALKQIAGSLGAYDAATETITDPRTWKEILNTGMLMNFDMAGARFGTKMFGPDIGLEIGTAVKEVMATGDTDVAAALREVRDQFREAMALVVDAMKDKDSDTQQRMLETLQNIAALQGRTADASQKMARLAAN